MTFRDYSYQWLLDRGYQPHQAAAIVGNLVQESGVRPDGVVGDNGTAFGIAQWRGDRYLNLQKHAAANGRDWRNIDAQLEFLNHELNGSERRAGDELRAAPDVRTATRAFMAFERPAGWTPQNPEAGHGWANRYGEASRLAGAPIDPGASAGPFAPPVVRPAPAAKPGDGTLASAIAMMAPDGEAGLTQSIAPMKTAEPLFGGDEEVDVSAFQPRTARIARPRARS